MKIGEKITVLRKDQNFYYYSKSTTYILTYVSRKNKDVVLLKVSHAPNGHCTGPIEDHYLMQIIKVIMFVCISIVLVIYYYLKKK